MLNIVINIYIIGYLGWNVVDFFINLDVFKILLLNRSIGDFFFFKYNIWEREMLIKIFYLCLYVESIFNVFFDV